MADAHEKWNNDEIASHLKSAVEALTPNVLDRIDLDTPQLRYIEQPKRLKVYRKMRRAVTAAAACLCVAALYGGVMHYQNTRVDSVIGLDVNPSIEISVNRKDKILETEALNEDAVTVLADMDLEGVDLNIGVNAIIGSMVRCGYLDELDNAILVTVTNEDTEKASVLRKDVVTDIETSLEAHKVNAVVYDQQATDTQEIGEIADQYNISYGKACFLYELVEENGLSEAELEAFAGMTMEEIAREIAERSYQIGGTAETEEASSQNTTSAAETETSQIQTESSEESQSTESVSTSQPTATAPPVSTAGTPETEEQEEEAESGKKARIDYVDYYEGILDVTFKERVRWKNPTISVQDSNGGSYSAKITDTGPDSCAIEIEGLEGGESYVFILSGVKPREGGSYGTVKGYFDTPDISDGAIGNGDEESPDDPDEDDGDTEEETEESEGEQGSQENEGSKGESQEGTETSDAAAAELPALTEPAESRSVPPKEQGTEIQV